MGRDSIIDTGTLGDRQIVDMTPSYSNTIGMIFNCIKGADNIELRE